jgi:hypothetical protein
MGKTDGNQAVAFVFQLFPTRELYILPGMNNLFRTKLESPLEAKAE